MLHLFPKRKIQIPPIDIAKRFNAMLEPIYKEIFSVGFEIEKLGAARELLLPHLMLHDFQAAKLSFNRRFSSIRSVMV